MLPGDKWNRKKFRKVITSTCTSLKDAENWANNCEMSADLYKESRCLEQPTGLASAIKRSCHCQQQNPGSHDPRWIRGTSVLRGLSHVPQLVTQLSHGRSECNRFPTTSADNELTTNISTFTFILYIRRKKNRKMCIYTYIHLITSYCHFLLSQIVDQDDLLHLPETG